MANGKFHGKRKTGIKITNPLTLPVSVRIHSPTGALHTGDGKDTWRTIKPGETLSIPTKGRAEVDIDVHIIRYDEVGNPNMLGVGGWQPIVTIAKQSKTPVKAGPVMLLGRGEVRNGRWRNIKTWDISPGFSGLLKAISIGLTGDAEARVEVGLNKVHKARQDTTLNYQNNMWLAAGEVVKVRGRSKNGNGGTVDVSIAGELFPVGTAGHPAEKKATRGPGSAPEKKPKKEPEETPLRSLGDLIEEMEKREEVKV